MIDRGREAFSEKLHLLNRRSALLGATLLAGALCVGAPMAASRAQQPTPQSSATPNIVFILMDNLGYGELGVYGGGIIRGAPTRIVARCR